MAKNSNNVRLGTSQSGLVTTAPKTGGTFKIKQTQAAKAGRLAITTGTKKPGHGGLINKKAATAKRDKRIDSNYERPQGIWPSY